MAAGRTLGKVISKAVWKGWAVTRKSLEETPQEAWPISLSLSLSLADLGKRAGSPPAFLVHSRGTGDCRWEAIEPHDTPRLLTRGVRDWDQSDPGGRRWAPRMEVSTLKDLQLRGHSSEP